jgi:hypothetical protein
MLVTNAKVRGLTITPSWYFFAIWLLLYVVVASNHEPWVDELQQINIALSWGQELSLLEISYLEATPPYWFALLKAVGTIFGVAEGLKLLGFSIAALTAFFWYRIESIPLWARVGLSFSLVVFFEHLVVVRVYAATLLLLVIYLWLKRNSRIDAYPKNWLETLAICLLGASSIWGAYLGALILLMGIAADVRHIRNWQVWFSFTVVTSISLAATQIGQGRNWPGRGNNERDTTILELLGNPVVALRNSLLPIPNAELQSGTFALSSLGETTSALTALMMLMLLALVFLRLGRPALVLFLASSALMTIHMSFIYLGGLRHWGYYFLMLGVAVFFSRSRNSRLEKIMLVLILSAQAASTMVIAGQDVFRSFSVGQLLSQAQLPSHSFIVALDDPANVMANFNLKGEDIYSVKGGERRPYWLLNDKGQRLNTELPSSCDGSRSLFAISSAPPSAATSGSVSELTHGFNSTEDKLWVITWPICTADSWEEALAIAEK